jgi:diacylglycerol kinase (ATP)
MPAGTANLLAANLKIPADLTEAVRVGLKGEPRRFDTGSLNGEHFAVMAGAGFDAPATGGAGGRPGRLARGGHAGAEGVPGLARHCHRRVMI